MLRFVWLDLERSQHFFGQYHHVHNLGEHNQDACHWFDFMSHLFRLSHKKYGQCALWCFCTKATSGIESPRLIWAIAQGL